MTKWEKIKNSYIDKDIKIIPIRPNEKIPMIDKWNEQCSSDYMQVLYWYSNNKDMNFAIPCYENNLFVIDLDKHDVNKDGVVNFTKLLKELNIDSGDIKTLIQQTPSGGLHYIFQSDEDLCKVNGIANAFKDYPGIDLRNRNYIVSVPSVINGKEYVFMNNYDVQPMPPELKKYILENVNLKTEKKEPYKKPTHVEVGDRDNQLFSYISNLYYHPRLDYDEILLLTYNFNENVLENPFPERVIKYKINKIFEKDRSKCIFIKLSEE